MKVKAKYDPKNVFNFPQSIPFLNYIFHLIYQNIKHPFFMGVLQKEFT